MNKRRGGSRSLKRNDSDLATAELRKTCHREAGGFQRGRSEGFRSIGDIGGLGTELIDHEVWGQDLCGFTDGR